MSPDQLENAPRVFVHIIEPNGDHRVTAYRDATIEHDERPSAVWNQGYLRHEFTGGQLTFTASSECLVSEGATADAATMKMLAHLSGRVVQLDEQVRVAKADTRNEDKAAGAKEALLPVLEAIMSNNPDVMYRFWDEGE